MAIDLWRTRPFISGSMRGAVDRLFEEAFAPFYGGRDGGTNASGQTGVQTLPVTIWETNDAFHAALMAPGLDENSINAEYRHGLLLITMPKAEEARPRQVRVQVGERGHLPSQTDSLAPAESNAQASAEGTQQNFRRSTLPTRPTALTSGFVLRPTRRDVTNAE